MIDNMLQCCELCNNDDKNRGRKTRITQYTDFTWFGIMSTSTGTMAQNFTITEIGLNRKRVFIITLNIIKLQKYYTLNIPYCGGFAPHPQPKVKISHML